MTDIHHGRHEAIVVIRAVEHGGESAEITDAAIGRFHHQNPEHFALPEQLRLGIGELIRSYVTHHFFCRSLRPWVGKIVEGIRESDRALTLV